MKDLPRVAFYSRFMVGELNYTMGNGLKMAEPTNMIEKKTHKIYPIEIVDFPSYKMVDLSIVFC